MSWNDEILKNDNVMRSDCGQAWSRLGQVPSRYRQGIVKVSSRYRQGIVKVSSRLGQVWSGRFTGHSNKRLYVIDPDIGFPGAKKNLFRDALATQSHGTDRDTISVFID